MLMMTFLLTGLETRPHNCLGIKWHPSILSKLYFFSHAMSILSRVSFLGIFPE